MTDLQMWSLLVGFALPLLVSVVQRPGFSPVKRTAITAASAVAAGVGTAYFNGDFNGRSVVSSVLFVLVTSLAVYKGLWKTSGIAPKIEVATTPGDQRVGYAAVVEPTALEDRERGAVSQGLIGWLLIVVVVVVIVVLLT